MTTADLPGINACLNGMATLLLAAGYYYIRRENVGRHKVCMVSAFAVSCLFLVSYVTYHATHGSTKFTYPGPIVRTFYFSILITHVVLAAAIVPMVLVTLTRALRGQFDKHKRIARFTWPVWMYVSVTGVAVYLMLYRLFPGGG